MTENKKDINTLALFRSGSGFSFSCSTITRVMCFYNYRHGSQYLYSTNVMKRSISFVTKFAEQYHTHPYKHYE